MSNELMTEEEREGVKMIQALLSLDGESESEEISLSNWREFSESARAQTKWAYETFIQKRGNRGNG